MDLDDMKFQMDINGFIRQWTEPYRNAILFEKTVEPEVIFINGERRRYYDFRIIDMETVGLEDDEGYEDIVKFKDIDEVRL